MSHLNKGFKMHDRCVTFLHETVQFDHIPKLDDDSLESKVEALRYQRLLLSAKDVYKCSTFSYKVQVLPDPTHREFNSLWLQQNYAKDTELDSPLVVLQNKATVGNIKPQLMITYYNDGLDINRLNNIQFSSCIVNR